MIAIRLYCPSQHRNRLISQTRPPHLLAPGLHARGQRRPCFDQQRDEKLSEKKFQARTPRFCDSPHFRNRFADDPVLWPTSQLHDWVAQVVRRDVPIVQLCVGGKHLSYRHHHSRIEVEELISDTPGATTSIAVTQAVECPPPLPTQSGEQNTADTVRDSTTSLDQEPIDDEPSIRMPVKVECAPPPPANSKQLGVHNTLLYNGSKFKGSQKSKGNSYDVEVVLQVRRSDALPIG